MAKKHLLFFLNILYRQHVRQVFACLNSVLLNYDVASMSIEFQSLEMTHFPYLQTSLSTMVPSRSLGPKTHRPWMWGYDVPSKRRQKMLRPRFEIDTSHNRFYNVSDTKPQSLIRQDKVRIQRKPAWCESISFFAYFNVYPAEPVAFGRYRV
jgi:hypothetical protein